MNHNQKGEAHLESLVQTLGPSKVSTSRVDRLSCARDQWPKGLMELRDGCPAPEPPAAVVWPETVDDVVALMGWARESGVGLVPYGGGTGLSGGAMPRRGDVVVDMKRFSGVEWIREDDNLVRVKVGTVGVRLEAALRREGMTLGHLPSSITSSTVGGWLAVGSAGQASSRYGKIEDMVVSVEVVLPSGLQVETNPWPASGVGPHWTRFFVGSEGALGILTRATFKVRRVAQTEHWRGYAFPSVAAGCEAMRRVMQRGLRPAVLRLYDELDSLVIRTLSGTDSPDTLGDLAAASRRKEAGRLPKHWSPRRAWAELGQTSERMRSWMDKKLLKLATGRPGFFNRFSEKVVGRVWGKGCLLVLGVEGNTLLADAELERCHRELERAGAVDLGEEPGLSWRDNRYSVPFKQSDVFTDGAFVETVEVAATWDKVMEIYEAARRALAPHAFIMAHFGHAYPEGCAMSFTVVGSADDCASSRSLYEVLMRDLLSSVTRHGGSISHHHGIGRSRTQFLLEELGDVHPLWNVVKETLDPMGIMNPGKLLRTSGPDVSSFHSGYGSSGSVGGEPLEPSSPEEEGGET